MLTRLFHPTRQCQAAPDTRTTGQGAGGRGYHQSPNHGAQPWPRSGGALLAAALMTSGLAGCGGDDSLQPDSPATASTPAESTSPTAALTKRTLLIDLDGVTYDAVKNGIAAGTLPNLAKLQPQLAYSGGVVNDVSQQPNLDAPGWATILTGSWADRHRVYTIAAGQKLANSSVFGMVKAADSANLNGAAVASSTLATLLSSERAGGNLDTLTDCSAASTSDDCVTNSSVTLIGKGNYATVVAQYHAAQDLALYPGLSSSAYAAELSKLDAAIGTLVSETTKNSQSQWLVVVTGSHGLNANGKADGLWKVPQSATFVATNQVQNNGQQGAMPALPSNLSDLYAYASIADVTPTVLAHQGATPADASYAMDGAQLIGGQAVSRLLAKVNSNATTHPTVTLSWNASADQDVAIWRDGTKIATVPAGTTTYTDAVNTQTQLASGKYQFNYAAVAGTAARATLTPSVSYVQPVALASTLTSGLTVYYPFGEDPQKTAPVDRMGNSTLGPWATAANGGSTIEDPLGGTGLFVDTNIATTDGYDGYKLAPTSSAKDVVNAAVANSGAFTIGFWFKAPACSTNTVGEPIFSNKTNYASSGGSAGVLIGMFGCGAEFNVADGSKRTDTNSPYITFTENRWVYLAMVVDIQAQTMKGYVFDPVLGSLSQSKAITAGTNFANLVGVNANSEIGFGLGEDGTGRFYMVKNKQTAGSYNPANNTIDKSMQMAFSDLGMWNRALTSAELASIFNSETPLSSLLTAK